MALDKQTTSFRFTGGVETKADAKAVAPAKLLALENAVFTSPGKLQKRAGFTSLGRRTSAGALLSDGQALMGYRGELLAADPSNVYSYNAAARQWIDKGPLVSCYVTKASVSSDVYDDLGADGATHSSGLQAYVWQGGTTGLYYAVLDSATGQSVVRSTLISATGFDGRVLVAGNSFIFLYFDDGDLKLHVGTLPVANPTASIAFTAITSATFDENGVDFGNPHYDAAVVETAVAGRQLYVAFNNNQSPDGGTSLWRLPASNPVAPSAHGKVAFPGDSMNAGALFGDATLGRVILATHDTSKLKARILDAALADASDTPLVLAEGDVETISNVTAISGAVVSTGDETLPTEIRLFWTVATADPIYRTRTATISSDVSSFAILDGPSDFLRSLALAAKVFVYGSQVYVPLVYDSTLQSTYFVADGDRTVVARFMAGSAGGVRSGIQHLSAASQVDETSVRIALGELHDGGETEGTFTSAGVRAVTLDFFEPTQSYSRAELGQNLHVSGGLLWMYDGVSAVEHGFLLYPEGLAVASAGSGHTYQYVATYEWTDNFGQVHRSTPSVPVTYEATNAIDGSHTASVTVPALRVTNKRSDVGGGRAPVRVTLYRTTDVGTVFRLAGIALNDPTADTVTIVDGTADSDLLSAPELYTTGGVLENAPAPPSASIAVHRNRLFALDSMNPLQLRYSKQAGSAAPVEFSDLLVMQFDPRGGDLTAVASLDDKLVGFKRSSIFAVTGQGPDDTGVQSDFSDAQLITTDCGCINPRSVVMVPDGLMFQSAKGIYLLDRALRVTYVGAPVEAYNAETITSAVLLESTNQVRFTIGSRRALVFDYLAGQWSVFTNIGAVDSLIWDGQHTYLRADGAVLQETPGVFTDDGSHVPLRLATAWLQFAGTQGLQRVYKALLLGEYLSPHRLRVQVAYDFNPAVVQDELVTPTGSGVYGSESPYGSGSSYGGEFPLMQWRLFLSRQKTQAVQITIEDVPSGSPGESLSLSALSFEVGLKKGLFKVPAARSA